MNKLIPMAAAAGLMVGGLSACGGESAKEAPAIVDAYGYGIDGQVVEDQWMHYENKLSVPGGDVRNRDSRNVFAGCHEVDDWIRTWSDSECYDQSGVDIWSYCVSGEDTHCEARYERRYSYDLLEQVKVRDCLADYSDMKHEYKVDEPATNEACLAMVGDDQRVIKTAHYVLWISAENPSYDEKHPEKHPKNVSNTVDITAAEWAQLTYESEVTAKVSGDRVVDVVIK